MPFQHLHGDLFGPNGGVNASTFTRLRRLFIFQMVNKSLHFHSRSENQPGDAGKKVRNGGRPPDPLTPITPDQLGAMVHVTLRICCRTFSSGTLMCETGTET